MSSGSSVTAPSQGVAWGTTVVTREIRGIPTRVYDPRPLHVTDLLAEADRWPDRTFLVHGARRVTFAGFRAAVGAAAAHLRAHGVGRGDRVVLLAANTPEWVVAWFATLQLGAVAVLANAWWSTEEVARAVRSVDPALVVADRRRSELLPAGARRLSTDDLAAVVDAGAAAPERPDAGAAPAGATEDDPAVLLFTSGSTGAPKAAVLAHRAVIGNIHNLLHGAQRLPHQLDPTAKVDVNLLAVPLFHISGLQSMLIAAVTGGRLVFRDGRFDPAAILGLIERERVTSFGAVPTMLTRLLEHPALGDHDTSSLRAISTGGMPVPAALMDRLRAAFPTASRRVGTVYGLSESGGVLTSMAGPDYQAHPGAAGRPFPTVELALRDADRDGVGEVLARSATTMDGYWGLDDSPVDHDGWLHTGDLGRIDDGVLTIVGRSKDVIIRAGENVAAPHVEELLAAHPAIAECVVVGLPDDDLGEEVAAIVVVGGEAPPSEEELTAYAASRLASFEVPTAWWIRRDPLPTVASGKPMKARLAADFPRR